MLAKHYFPLKQNKKCRRILTIANTQIMHTCTGNLNQILNIHYQQNHRWKKGQFWLLLKPSCISLSGKKIL